MEWTKSPAELQEFFAAVVPDEPDIERWENVLRTANICRKLEYQEIERWLT